MSVDPKYAAQGLPPPKYGQFVGGNRPPGGGFARYQHLSGPSGQAQQSGGRITYDGKRMRKAVHRRTIDYHATCIRYVHHRLYWPYPRDRHAVHPGRDYLVEYLPTFEMIDNPLDAVTTKIVHTSTNKIRCPIFTLKWTPDGRRIITGAVTGEFTLWNGLTFNFETILQAHDSAVRAMVWSHSDSWMVSGDHGGFIKYWQSNMNNLKIFQGHREPIRDLTYALSKNCCRCDEANRFSPSDTKFASCSDDATIRLWDFGEAREERILAGHGWDVKCIDWHPTKGLLASGSKDNLVKLWDPKSGDNLATFHGHKNTVMAIQWNRNGNYLLAASRDQLIKLYDIRTMKELQNFKGHGKEVNSIAWHPIHENLFVSGGSEGSLLYWLTGEKDPIEIVPQAHESNIWALDWHPLGHILVSGSNDHHTRWWTRPRPREEFNDVFHSGDGHDIMSSFDGGLKAPVAPKPSSSGAPSMPPLPSTTGKPPQFPPSAPPIPGFFPAPPRPSSGPPPLPGLGLPPRPSSNGPPIPGYRPPPPNNGPPIPGYRPHGGPPIPGFNPSLRPPGFPPNGPPPPFPNMPRPPPMPHGMNGPGRPPIPLRPGMPPPRPPFGVGMNQQQPPFGMPPQSQQYQQQQHRGDSRDDGRRQKQQQQQRRPHDDSRNRPQQRGDPRRR